MEKDSVPNTSLLSLDLGNLLAVDALPVKLGANIEGDLQELSRQRMQSLITDLFNLPSEKIDNIVVAKLPEGSTVLPRAKPIPKPKPLTRWQQFANIKGIQKRKKGRMVWDEANKEWRPRWGYKRAGDRSKDWVAEVPDHVDPFEDQFAKRKKARDERVAKNEYQHLKNISHGMLNTAALTEARAVSKDQIQRTVQVARSSTASMGKFDRALPKEKALKPRGKKRKFESNIQESDKEKQKSLDILNAVLKKQPKLDVQRATNQHIALEQKSRSFEGENSGDSSGKFRRNRKTNKGQGGGKKGKRDNKGKKSKHSASKSKKQKHSKSKK